MRLMVLAGLMITLPALVVAVFSFIAGRPFIALAALASFAVNSVPFLVGVFLFRSRGSGEDDAGH